MSMWCCNEAGARGDDRARRAGGRPAKRCCLDKAAPQLWHGTPPEGRTCGRGPPTRRRCSPEQVGRGEMARAPLKRVPIRRACMRRSRVSGSLLGKQAGRRRRQAGADDRAPERADAAALELVAAPARARLVVCSTGRAGNGLSETRNQPSGGSQGVHAGSWAGDHQPLSARPGEPWLTWVHVRHGSHGVPPKLVAIQLACSARKGGRRTVGHMTPMNTGGRSVQRGSATAQGRTRSWTGVDARSQTAWSRCMACTEPALPSSMPSRAHRSRSSPCGGAQTTWRGRW